MGKKQARGLINKTIAERLLANNMEQAVVHKEGFSRSSIWRVAKRIVGQGMAPDDFIRKKKGRKKTVDEGERALREVLAREDANAESADADEEPTELRDQYPVDPVDPDDALMPHERGQKALQRVIDQYKTESEAEEYAEQNEHNNMIDDNNGKKERKIPIAAISSRKVSTVFKIADDLIQLEPDTLFECYFLYKQLVAKGADNTFSDCIKAGLEVLWSLAQSPPEAPQEIETEELVAA